MDKINIPSYLHMHSEAIKGFAVSMVGLLIILKVTATNFDITEIEVLVGYALLRVAWFLYRNPIEYHDCMNRRSGDR